MSEDILSGLENLNLDEPDNTRKLFIGGLSWMTTEDGLRQYFENLGLHVDTVVIMRDKNGKSRGFGFLTLGSLQEIEIAISISLFLDGRKVEAKRAIPKSDLSNHAKKIFVGGIPMSLTNTDFRKYFESFGKVLETQIMTDRESGRSRGFGFVTFEEENVAAVVLRMSHTIQNKPVEVKPAEPKNNSQTLPNAPISSMYMPSNMNYSSAFNSSFNFEQTNYLNQRQGRVVYLPHVYESLSTADSQGYNFLSESLIKRSNTAPVIQRPTVPNTPHFKISQPFYERPETLSNPQNHDLYPLNTIGTGLELRTERAFSAPCTDSSFLPDDLLGRIGKLSPPIKRRNANTNTNSTNGPTPAISIPASTLFSNTSSTLFSNPPNGLLRTDPTNWFKPTSITSTEPNVSLHKYFQ